MMSNNVSRLARFSRLRFAALLLAVAAGGTFWQVHFSAASTGPLKYQVDAAWPKPLPAPKDASGQTHQWITGDVGASCVDSHDHIFIVNRSFQKNGVSAFDGTQSVAAPPVLEFDTAGNLINSWGDATLAPSGVAAVLPNSIHGCFVDYEDNIWIGGNADGVAEKWSHDGKKMLLQIGDKGQCDGPETAPEPPMGHKWFGRPNRLYPTCAEPGGNKSKTRLNGVADIYVDPGPDPVTGDRGDVYLADGYGNNRVAVFDSKGKFVRQWGSAGDGEGQFSVFGGGHPHCVNISKEGWVYTCDRENARIHVFDKLGKLKQTFHIDPPDQKSATWRVTDVDFSHDAAQTYMFVMDLGSGKLRILDRKSGNEVGNIGRPGAMAGEFRYAHTIAVDSKDNIYIAETASGRRIQKFAKVN